MTMICKSNVWSLKTHLEAKQASVFIEMVWSPFYAHIFKFQSRQFST